MTATRPPLPNSLWAATAPPAPDCPPLAGERRAEVAIVGGGFTGLSAALHLAEKGVAVTLLEAAEPGFGASGRNGGQLGSGQRMDQHFVEKQVGRDDATKLWALAEDAKALVKSLIAKHDIDCHLKPGIAHMAFSNREVEEEHAYADHLAQQDRPSVAKLRVVLTELMPGVELCQRRCPLGYRVAREDLG